MYLELLGLSISFSSRNVLLLTRSTAGTSEITELVSFETVLPRDPMR
jgi:hypothetical protein